MAARGRAAGSVEKRKDTDGVMYTKAEFKEQYGGYAQWDAAAPAPAREKSARGAGRGAEEKRVDPSDGKSYAKAEFKAQYGGYAEWDAAAPGAGKRGRGGARGAEGKLDEWVAAKKAKDFATADRLRAELKDVGVDAEAARPPPGRGAGPGGSRGAAAEGKLDEWVEAKRAKDFATADRLRDELKAAGIDAEHARPAPGTYSARAGARGAAAAAEQRRDSDGGLYSKAEFRELYGGYEEWDAAPRGAGGRGGRGAGRGGGGSVEKRRDSDGKFYTKGEFVDQYGGFAEWDAAAARAAPAGAGTGAAWCSPGVMIKRARAAQEGRSVMIFGIPYKISWHDLKALAAESGECTNADIYEEPDGRSKGCGVVVFASAAGAKKFIATQNGKEWKGRELHVRADNKTEAPPSDNFVSDGQGGAAYCSPGVLQKRAEAAAEGRSVMVFGLPYRGTGSSWHDLKKLALESGECTNADIYEDSDGRSKGCGVVIFTAAATAKRFIAKWDGKEQWGRTLSVRSDEKTEAPPRRH